MMIWIKCPALGHIVPTGIEIDQRSFEMLPGRVSGMVCSACGRRHEWRKTDAWLVDDDRVVNGDADQLTAINASARRVS